MNIQLYKYELSTLLTQASSGSLAIPSHLDNIIDVSDEELAYLPPFRKAWLFEYHLHGDTPIPLTLMEATTLGSSGEGSDMITQDTLSGQWYALSPYEYVYRDKYVDEHAFLEAAANTYHVYQLGVNVWVLYTLEHKFAGKVHKFADGHLYYYTLALRGPGESVSLGY